MRLLLPAPRGPIMTIEDREPEMKGGTEACAVSQNRKVLQGSNAAYSREMPAREKSKP
jgi:hypothetical protein